MDIPYLSRKFVLSAALAAVVVAVLLNVGAYLWATSGLYSAVIAGLLLGLAAAGLYDTAKTAAR